jgi:hypothetical protein
MSGKVHIGVEYENYRLYYDDKENIKCKCGVFCLIANPHSRIVGEVCKKCNSVYKHPKLWRLKCSVCTPRNSSPILSKVHIGKDFTFVKGGK